MGKQSGFTLLEMLAALAITGLLVVEAGSFIDERTQDLKDANTSQYQAMINSAALNYVKSISESVTAANTAANPKISKFSDLVAAGFIPSAYHSQTTNPYQQASCIMSYRNSPTEIVTLIVTEGGQDIPLKRLPKIASMIGLEGGWVGDLVNPTATPLTAYGIYDKWTQTVPPFNCSGQSTKAGDIASLLYYDTNSASNDFLYRNQVPGHPELNTMSTPLILDAQKVIGDDCSPYGPGAIARDSTGALLVCKTPDLKFEPIGSNYWGDPVDIFESLPICNSSIANQTRIVKTPTIGTGRRAYTCNGAGTWDPLFQDDYGNIIIPGTANISKLSGDLQITSTATENTACSPNGRIASDANGLILSCQTGSWKKAFGAVSGFFSSGSGGYTIITTTSSAICGPNRCVNVNRVTGGCSCPSGKAPVSVAGISTTCGITAQVSTTTTYTCE